MDVDAASNAAGEVNLVVATNTFQQQTPSSAPSCDCTNGFTKGDFSFEVEGSNKPGIISVSDVGFTVPRLGSTFYTPGTPSMNDIHVKVSSGTSSPSFAATRTFFTTWADNVAQGNTDRRGGRLSLLTPTQSSLAQIDSSHLEPVTLFDPMTVDGAQSITLSADNLNYQPVESERALFGAPSTS